MKQHKWAKEIKAWADGGEIESKWENCDWELDDAPRFYHENYQFRIKPQPKEQLTVNLIRASDVKVKPKHLWVYLNSVGRIEIKYGKAAGAAHDTWTLLGYIEVKNDITLPIKQ